MIKEFAVDPEALKTWDQLKYISEKFGVEQGRFISRFPKRWAELVEKGMSETSWRRRQQFVTRLVELKRGRKGALLSHGRAYLPGEEWRKNASRSHAECPFYALISNTVWPELPQAIPVEDANENHFAVAREIHVPRTAEALASVAAPLLQLSHEVLFVDPYFDPLEIRFLRPLRAFLQVFADRGLQLRKCEYHMKQHERARFTHPLKTFEGFEEACRRRLPRWIPEGIDLTLVRWRQFRYEDGAAGERLHARYVLTDIGGMNIESGLDDGKQGETTDVHLLSEEHWLRCRRIFFGESPDVKPAYTTDDLDSHGNHRRVSVTGTRKP